MRVTPLNPIISTPKVDNLAESNAKALKILSSPIEERDKSLSREERAKIAFNDERAINAVNESKERIDSELEVVWRKLGRAENK